MRDLFRVQVWTARCVAVLFTTTWLVICATASGSSGSNSSSGAASAPATAPSAADQVAVTQGEIPKEPAATLTGWAKQSRDPKKWQDLQGSIRDTLNRFRATGAAPSYTFDFKANYYFVVFASDDQEPTGEILRLLVHDPAPDQFAQRLPGVKGVVEVFLSADPLASLSSLYLITPNPNPLIANLPGFIKQFNLASWATALASTKGPKAPLPPPPGITVTITKVTFPHSRSSIAIADRIESPGNVDKAKLLEAVSELQKHMPGTVPYPPDTVACVECYQAILEATGTLLTSAMDEDSIQAPLDQRWQRLDNAVTEAYKATVRGDKCGRLTSLPNVAVITDLETRLHALTTKPKPAAVKGAFAYDNLPLTRFDYGAIAAVILSSGGPDTRVQVSGNVLSPNPLTGALTMATVNWHPIPYDSSQFCPGVGERLRIFAGLTITPDIGIGVGAGYGLVRGLTVNAGVARIRVDTLRAGDQIGQAPKDPNHPFATGSRTLTFVGLGYNF